VIFNIIGMALAALGLVTPTLAIAVMVLSIFAILINTLRVRGIDLHREEEPEIGPLAEVEFLVPSMVCEGCAEKISQALRPLPGVQEVRPKVPQQHVYVRYEPSRVKGAGAAQRARRGRVHGDGGIEGMANGSCRSQPPR